ncbi:MAG TPA: mandelate racemase/muconate lactonizing enzyme family protein [Terriglobia bacterium]|nr:mandelate racemase/muconate lactonizing enzyme family protein [Terriglobia bacterium]
MRITKIETAVIEANYDWTIVKVSTDKGIVGWGEAFFAPGLTATLREFNEFLPGEDPRDVDRLARLMRTAFGATGTAGMGYHAISAVETALWDIVGKATGLPVYQFLGGKYRDRVRIYADCHAGEGLASLSPVLLPRTPSWMRKGKKSKTRKTELSTKYHGGQKSEAREIRARAYARRAVEMKRQGFTALKFDVDVPTEYSLDDFNRTLTRREIELMVGLVAALRKAVGGDVDLAIDCHWNYGVNDAIKLARACEPYDLLWLEDPIPPENNDALARVTAATSTPIATGENHYQRHHFRELLEREAVDVLAPDFQKVGGLLEGRRIADMAEVHYIAVAPHNISSPIGTMAAAHLCAAIPNFLALEWHAASVPFFDDLVQGRREPLIQKGYIRVPERPGLGIELDESVAYKYRKPGEAFFGLPG